VATTIITTIQLRALVPFNILELFVMPVKEELLEFVTSVIHALITIYARVVNRNQRATTQHIPSSRSSSPFIMDSLEEEAAPT